MSTIISSNGTYLSNLRWAEKLKADYSLNTAVIRDGDESYIFGTSRTKTTGLLMAFFIITNRSLSMKAVIAAFQRTLEQKIPLMTIRVESYNEMVDVLRLSDLV